MTFAALASHLGFAALLALLSAAAVRLMIARPILDRPNARSAHTRPTPRGGGVGVVLAFLTGMAVLYLTAEFARIAERQFLGVLAAAFAIAAVSLVDDARGLSARLRLLAQIAAALVAVASGLVVEAIALPWFTLVPLGPLAIPFTLVWIVGCTNAMNFMDGLDGLVGLSSLLAAAALAAIAAWHGGWFVYAAALFLAAGFAGFLPFNWSPARIFMGDVGAQFAGFVFAVLGIAAARFDAQPLSFLIVPLLLFGLLFDAGFTLLRRALAGERLAEAHRSHLYQMASRAGWPTRAIAAAHGGFVLFHAGLAAGFLALPPELKPLVLLPALLVQALWLAVVLRAMRRAGIGFATPPARG